MLACNRNIVTRSDPKWDRHVSREAIRKEAANCASKQAWESEVCLDPYDNIKESARMIHSLLP